MFIIVTIIKDTQNIFTIGPFVSEAEAYEYKAEKKLKGVVDYCLNTLVTESYLPRLEKEHV